MMVEAAVTDGDLLLAAIAEEPEDRTVRAAYCDWCLEQGLEPRVCRDPGVHCFCNICMFVTEVEK